ncbi:hypothetical protein KP509_10G036600 [Ceratopteris richardii]|uniref:Transmembrane protein n=1 Tax=Ceratopteris richardii TaxID=49495 RepID=A0A8T2U0S7_CERRI|nr:hypothetical protein KP509_10G036600 [Ceratopteris richardii]
MATQDVGRCYKRATAVVCACNFLVVICIIYVLFVTTSSTLSALRPSRREPQGFKLRNGAAAHYQSSLEARRTMEPTELIQRVHDIKEEVRKAEMQKPRSVAARERHVAAMYESLKRLKEGKINETKQVAVSSPIDEVRGKTWYDKDK